MLLVHNASQVVTPETGGGFREIENGAIASDHGKLVYVGPSDEALTSFPNAEKITAKGKTVLPGFVDSHTHLIFAGDRSSEFLKRLEGATYQEIAATGGGILSTVRATREETPKKLLQNAQAHLQTMLAFGTTTVEVKSGYGLNWETEKKILSVAQQLKTTAVQDLAITFLGAHDFPPEQSRENYLASLLNQMLPAVAQEKLADFSDVFCDQGYYSPEETRVISNKAHELGLGVKVHVDELADVDGARLAAELRAISADHLIFANKDGIKKMAEAEVTAVLLPGTSLGLKSGTHAPARKMIDSGVRVALATDFNPGTCYCHSMQFILQIGIHLYRLTPQEALRAATLHAAAAIGKQKQLGSLETGKQADYLIFDIPHYSYLFYNLGINFLETVIKRGEIAWSKKTNST
jgi:imidazolonepropionase